MIDLREQVSALQAKCDAYERALEIYARPDEAFPWRGVIARETLAAQNSANYKAACEVLSQHKRPTKEAADE